MMQNPIFNREIKISSRSVRIPLIITLFNGILCLVTLVNMYSAVAQVESTAAIQYTSFMDMYEFVTTMEFILLMFIMPAMTAASISGERERQTLEMMLTTKMTAAQVVMGKLMSALSTLLLLIVSSFPAIAMVFVYGGVTFWDMVSMILCYIATAFFTGSLGICFSALFKRSTVSTVTTYGVLIAAVAGTYFINRFSYSLSSMHINHSMAAYGFGEQAAKISSGNAIYLLLLNPAATFYTILNGQLQGNTPVAKLASQFGMEPSGFIMEYWVPLSLFIQVAFGIALAVLAVHAVEPVKRKMKKQMAKK